MANKEDSYEPVTFSEEYLLSKCWICGVSLDLGGYVLNPKGIPYWCTKCLRSFDMSHGKRVVRKFSKDIVLKCSACNHQTTTDINSRDKLDEFCSTCQKPLSIEYIIKRIDGLGNDGEHKCPICLEIFPNNPALNRHTSTHLFHCIACDLRFTTKTAFIKHMKMHRTEERKERLCKCSVCGRSAPDSESLQIHMKKQHICPICGKICRRGNHLGEHIRRFHTGEKPFLCTHCGKSFCDQASLSRHRKLHSDVKPHVCNACGKRFRVKYNLKVHFLKAHSRTHQCESCGKCFFHNWQLTNHSVMHTLEGVPKFECPVCFKVFFSMEEKDFHRETNHKQVKKVKKVKNYSASQYPKKRVECLVCGKTYSTKANLKEHMYSHTNDGSGKYKCTTCGKDLVSPQNLRQHIKRVHGKKIMCPTCGKSLAPCTYNRHKLRHLGVKNHTCSVCGKSFLFNYMLKQHMRVHNGEKPFKCTVCDVAFSDSSTLIKHKNRLHPEHSIFREFAEFHGLGPNQHVGYRPQHVGVRQFDGPAFPPYNSAQTVPVYANL